MTLKRCLAPVLVLLLAACQGLPPGRETPVPVPPVPAPAPAKLIVSTWDAIEGWREEDPTPAWSAFLTGCSALNSQPTWQTVCSSASRLQDMSPTAIKQFFEVNFTPYQVINGDGSDSGIITGYYEPLLHGSRTYSKHYRYPVYGTPDDLLTIDLSDLYPELKGMRLRGRLDADKKRVVPYLSRAQIDGSEAAAPLAGKELVWVEDAVELFFLQIQGSGRVELENGETLRIGYADQNGHPFRSIGKWLIDHGELTLDKASMQGIQAWARRNPDKLRALLDVNPSYVFFRELPADAPGPLGSLGVALTARRSLAVDARYIPLGAPVFLKTTWPNSDKPLQQLMLAQDTGGAIRGGVRADFFWGFGDDAGKLAGSMRQKGKMWVLLPNGYVLTQPLPRKP
jgi:membrane-bound lytic murein transglycosylase A